MKKLFLLVLLAGALFLQGCAGCQKDLKHMQSTMTGLNRKVTLYSADGNVIRTWQGTFVVEVEGPVASWIDSNGNEIKISGTFIIEEVSHGSGNSAVPG